MGVLHINDDWKNEGTITIVEYIKKAQLSHKYLSKETQEQEVVKRIEEHSHVMEEMVEEDILDRFVMKEKEPSHVSETNQGS